MLFMIDSHNNVAVTDNYEVSYDTRIGKYVVDEMIAPIIACLNKKGYKTAFCCSGHAHPDFITADHEVADPEYNQYNIYWPYDELGSEKITFQCNFESSKDAEYEQQYIRFAKKYEFDNLPDGWEITSSPEEPCIQIDRILKFKNIDYEKKEISLNAFNYYDTLDDILVGMRSLFKWAIDLPDLTKQ